MSESQVIFVPLPAPSSWVLLYEMCLSQVPFLSKGTVILKPLHYSSEQCVFHTPIALTAVATKQAHSLASLPWPQPLGLSCSIRAAPPSNRGASWLSAPFPPSLWSPTARAPSPGHVPSPFLLQEKCLLCSTHPLTCSPGCPGSHSEDQPTLAVNAILPAMAAWHMAKAQLCHQNAAPAVEPASWMLGTGQLCACCRKQ